MLEENEEKAGAIYKMVDHLIFSYLSRREYKNAESGICSDSLWLRRRDPDRPVLVQGSLHEKSLEDIVELFYHYGRFEVPAEFMYMEQQLRQISNQFTESLVNFSQTNKKRFQERHSRFMTNQRRSRQGESVLNQNTRLANASNLVQIPTVGQAGKTHGHMVQDDFVLPTSSRTSMYSQQQSVPVENNSVPYPHTSNDHTCLVEDGSSRRKSKPTKHHAQNVVKIIETIGTNKLQMRENKQIGEDNWDLGNDFEQLFQEFYPDMEVCNQMVLDVFDQGPLSLLDDVNGIEERTVMEKSREVFSHKLHNSIEQIVGEFEEGGGEQRAETETASSSDPVISMETESISISETSVDSSVEMTDPVETVERSRKAIEALPENDTNSQKNTVAPKSSIMEDLFGKEDGELTQSPKAKPVVIRRSPTRESEEKQPAQSSSKMKPKNLVETKEPNSKMIDRSRSPVRPIARPRYPSSSDPKTSLKAADKARGESPKVSKIDDDRRRERDRREERLREKQRVTDRERDRDRAREKDYLEREKKRDQDRSRPPKKEPEERPIGCHGRRLSAASTSSSSSAIDDRSPRPVIRDRSPRAKETKLSPKSRRSPVREKPREDGEIESKRATETKSQSKKVADKNEPDVVITKEVDSKLISSRHASDAVFHQMFPSTPRFQNQIKIPKMKISREGKALEPTPPSKEPEVIKKALPKAVPVTETVVKESPVILSKPPIVPVEERENTPDNVPELSKGVIDPLLKNRIPKCTMSDSRLACMLSNVQQRRETLASEAKEDEVRKRSAEEIVVETHFQPIDSEPANKVPKRRKINLEEAEEMLKRLHGS